MAEYLGSGTKQWIAPSPVLFSAERDFVLPTTKKSYNKCDLKGCLKMICLQ